MIDELAGSASTEDVPMGVPLLFAPSSHRQRRSLGSNDDDSNYQSLLVDKHGNEYDPYRLTFECRNPQLPEQLFKHEGVCIWNDEDLYDDMETWMGNWPEGCAQLSYPGRSKISIELLGTHSVGPFAPPQTTMVTHSTWRFSLCRKAT